MTPGPAVEAGDGAPRPELAVGAVAVDDGALLLVRRANAPEAGRWSLPGGRLESGESVVEAVEREVREETGLRAGVGRLVGWVERIDAEHHFVILDFAVQVSRHQMPAVAGGDATEVAWVPLDQVALMPVVSGLVEFLHHHGVL